MGVVIRNSLPHCPACGRQVSYRRSYCRACGNRISGSDSMDAAAFTVGGVLVLAFGILFLVAGVAGADQGGTDSGKFLVMGLVAAAAGGAMVVGGLRLGGVLPDGGGVSPGGPGPLDGVSYWVRCNVWDRDRYSPDGSPNLGSGTHVVGAVKEAIEGQLFGRFKVETHFLAVGGGIRYVAILRRQAPAYEAHISGYVDERLNGFEVRVPGTGFGVRITFPRDGVAAWDLLLENLCKIDRSVIEAKKSRARPLEFAPRQEGAAVQARVDALQGPPQADPPKALSPAPWAAPRDAPPAQVPALRPATPTPEERERQERKRRKREAYLEKLRSRGVEPGPFAWYGLLPDWGQAIVMGLTLAVPLVLLLVAVFRPAADPPAPAPAAQPAPATAAPVTAPPAPAPAPLEPVQEAVAAKAEDGDEVPENEQCGLQTLGGRCRHRVAAGHDRCALHLGL